MGDDSFRGLRLEKLKTVLIYPSWEEFAESVVEGIVRDAAIEVGASPPTEFKKISIPSDNWQCIARYAGSRTFFTLKELEDRTGRRYGGEIGGFLASFTSRQAASTFAYETSRLALDTRGVESVAKTDLAAQDHAPSGNDRKRPLKKYLYLHLLEAAPIDLYPLSRVLSHPSLGSVEFEESPYMSMNYNGSNARHIVPFKGTKWQITGIKPTHHVSNQNGPDRLAQQLAIVPLKYTCFSVSSSQTVR